jgi:hypothetical protein
MWKGHSDKPQIRCKRKKSVVRHYGMPATTKRTKRRTMINIPLTDSRFRVMQAALYQAKITTIRAMSTMREGEDKERIIAQIDLYADLIEYIEDGNY